MTLGGYANRLAHIDLTKGKVTYDPVPEEWMLKYIGGRGLGVKYVFENGPNVDPLTRHQHHIAAAFHGGQETTVGADDSERHAIAPGQLIGAGV